MTDPEPASPLPVATLRTREGWERLPMAAWLVALGLCVETLGSALSSFLFTYQAERLMRSDSDTRDILASMHRYDQLFTVLLLITGAAVVIGVAYLTRAPRSTGVRRLALAAAVGLGLLVVQSALTFGESTLSDSRPLTEFLLGAPGRVVLALVHGTAMIALLAVIARLAGAVRLRLPGFLIPSAALCIVSDVGIRLHAALSDHLATRGWVWPLLAVRMAPYVASGLACAYGAYRCAVALDGRAGEAPAVSSPLGDECASGLDRYADALSWRIGVAILASLLLLLGIVGRSVGLLKLVGWMTPLASLLTSLIMLHGLYGYARQLGDSPAAGAAWTALATMLIGTVIEGCGFALVIEVVADPRGPVSVTALQETAGSAQSLSVLGMGVGFASLLVLLISFRQLARRLQRDDIRDTVSTVGYLLLVATIGVIAFRSLATDLRDLGAVITLAVFVLALALVAVVAYVRLIRALASAIRGVPRR